MRKKISTDINSPEYWVLKLQLGLCNCAFKFMQEHNMDRQGLQEYLGVPELQVARILNGNFNSTCSNFVRISMLLGYYPSINFVNQYHASVTK